MANRGRTYQAYDAIDKNLFYVELKSDTHRLALIEMTNYHRRKDETKYGNPPNGDGVKALWTKLKRYWITKASNMGTVTIHGVALDPITEDGEKDQEQSSVQDPPASPPAAIPDPQPRDVVATPYPPPAPRPAAIPDPQTRDVATTPYPLPNAADALRRPPPLSAGTMPHFPPAPPPLPGGVIKYPLPGVMPHPSLMVHPNPQVARPIPQPISPRMQSRTIWRPPLPILTPVGASEEKLPGTADSSDSTMSGELSPTAIFRSKFGDPPYISPTAGQRKEVRKLLKRRWRFARVIYQRAEERKGDARYGYPPRSNWLFVLPNDEGSIADEIAVKCWAVNHEPRDRKITKETIARNEIYINASLSQASCKNILRYRGYGRRNVTFKITTLKHPLHCSSYYIYTDYARAGDLTLLVDSAAEPRQEGHAISEHYIWYTLKCLVDALCVLRDGICPERTSKSGDAATALSQPWISVIHNDIKLENVFLGENDETYKSYKRILLADFDLSIKHWPGVSEAEHVAAFRHLGTPDWFPPERYQVPPGIKLLPDPTSWPLSEKADIWAVALIAYHMMTSALPDRYTRIRKTFRSWEASRAATVMNAFPMTALPQDYSVYLFTFLDKCLRYDYQQRPTLAEMRVEINEQLAKMDRRSRDEYKRSREDILPEFQVPFPSLNQEFSPGQMFEPSKKRRKPNNSQDPVKDEKARQEYQELVREWNNAAELEASQEQQRLLWRDFEREAWDVRSDDYLVQYDDPADSPRTEDPGVLGLAITRAMAIIRKRVDPEAEQIQLLDFEDFGLSPKEAYSAFSADLKLWVLENIRAFVANNWSDEESPQYKIRSCLVHAVLWGKLLMTWGGILEGGEQLKRPSLFHRAILDFVNHDPSVENVEGPVT